MIKFDYIVETNMKLCYNKSVFMKLYFCQNGVDSIWIIVLNLIISIKLQDLLKISNELVYLMHIKLLGSLLTEKSIIDTDIVYVLDAVYIKKIKRMTGT